MGTDKGGVRLTDLTKPLPQIVGPWLLVLCLTLHDAVVQVLFVGPLLPAEPPGLRTFVGRRAQ